MMYTKQPKGYYFHTRERKWVVVINHVYYGGFKIEAEAKAVADRIIDARPKPGQRRRRVSTGPMRLWWRDDGDGNRTVVCSRAVYGAAEMVGLAYKVFPLTFIRGVNSSDLVSAEKRGEGVWELRAGKWSKIK